MGDVWLLILDFVIVLGAAALVGLLFERLRLGSILGSLIGAAFIVLLPVVFKNVFVGALGWPTDIAQHAQIILLGALIIGFLIAEPHGIAALWRTAKEKLRLWPFPH